MAHRVEITVSDETLAGLDEARGHEPRASFVKRALEKALSETQGPTRREQAGPGPVGSSEPVRPAAPPSRVEERIPHSPPKRDLAGSTPAPAVKPRAVDPVVLARQAKLNAARYKK